MKKIEANGVTFVLHDLDFFFDSYTIAKPEITKSGHWEVWSAELESSDYPASIDDMVLLAEDKVLEIIADETLDYRSVNLMISAYLAGVEVGDEQGSTRHQRMTKFALDSLTGKIEDTELQDAVESYQHRRNRN